LEAGFKINWQAVERNQSDFAREAGLKINWQAVERNQSDFAREAGLKINWQAVTLLWGTPLVLVQGPGINFVG
jgi:hypothetical protein